MLRATSPSVFEVMLNLVGVCQLLDLRHGFATKFKGLKKCCKFRHFVGLMLNSPET